jgi:hypothetical protein
MKRSEFVQVRTNLWSSLLKAQGGPPNADALFGVSSRVEYDAEAAEAAGVRWEPEEPELPDRLAYFPFRTGKGGTLADAATGTALSDAQWHASLPVLVDTYNAWGPKGDKREELRHLRRDLETIAGYLPAGHAYMLRKGLDNILLAEEGGSL